MTKNFFGLKSDPKMVKNSAVKSDVTKNGFRHLIFYTKKLRTMFSSFKIWVLFKNSVRIAVRRLIKVLETIFCDKQ